jgi:hypothetical protein
LALLSCADKVTVISKVEGGSYIGGTIDNSSLDDAIMGDLTPQEYILVHGSHQRSQSTRAATTTVRLSTSKGSRRE